MDENVSKAVAELSRKAFAFDAMVAAGRITQELADESLALADGPIELTGTTTIRTHHAEIAEAVADARRWKCLRGQLALGRGDVFGVMADAIPDNATDTVDVIEPLIDAGMDAFIDAMHNSAREAGE